MGYKVIGYMFAKQSCWYKLRRLLFILKAILLVQTAGFCSNLGARWLFSSPAGFLLGAENPTISRETETQVPAAAPAPAALQRVGLS